MNDKYIELAICEAKKAYELNEVPVGAVIVQNNVLISATHNLKMNTNDIFGHAEILALKEAINKLGTWRLNDCEMYVTLEPCPMCAGAIAQARIKKIYIGTCSNISENKRIVSEILQNEQYYHKVDIEYLNNEECAKMLTNFFANKR